MVCFRCKIYTRTPLCYVEKRCLECRQMSVQEFNEYYDAILRVFSLITGVQYKFSDREETCSKIGL